MWEINVFTGHYPTYRQVVESLVWKWKRKLVDPSTWNYQYISHFYILDASCSVDLRLLAISSVFAIIVYIVLMLASMQSVNLFTELLYVSTLSAAIDDICWIDSWKYWLTMIAATKWAYAFEIFTECNKLHRFSVILSILAAKYWASISISFSTFASICGIELRNCRWSTKAAADSTGNCSAATVDDWVALNSGFSFFETGLAILILYSRLSATKCVILVSSSMLTEPCGNAAAKIGILELKLSIF